MTSKAQKLKGYTIPEEWLTEETQSFCIIIPAGEEYRRAAYSQLLSLGKWWQWKRDLEDPDSTRAKETAEVWRLLFQMNEECGTMSIDYEAWAEAFGIQMYKVVNDVAKQVVSGRTTDISVDGDGVVTDPTTTKPEDKLPEDNPATPDVDEGLEAQNGGSVRVVDYLQQILTKMEQWRLSGTIIDQQAADRLILLYGFEDTKANIFSTYYYATYAGAHGTITLNEDTLDSLFYCRGTSIATFSKYIYDNHATSGEVPALEVLAENLNPEQFANWFNEGTQYPATKYLVYSCTRIATEQATLDMSTAEIVTVSLSGVWKTNHRYRVQVSGTFTDSDNPNIISDAFWSVDTSTGIRTFQGANFIATAGVVALTAAEVPYQPSHAYNVIVEKTGGSAAGSLSRNNNPMNLPNTTGILTAIVTDEGEFVV